MLQSIHRNEWIKQINESRTGLLLFSTEPDIGQSSFIKTFPLEKGYNFLDSLTTEKEALEAAEIFFPEFSVMAKSFIAYMFLVNSASDFITNIQELQLSFDDTIFNDVKMYYHFLGKEISYPEIESILDDDGGVYEYLELLKDKFTNLFSEDYITVDTSEKYFIFYSDTHEFKKNLRLILKQYHFDSIYVHSSCPDCLLDFFDQENIYIIDNTPDGAITDETEEIENVIIESGSEVNPLSEKDNENIIKEDNTLPEEDVVTGIITNNTFENIEYNADMVLRTSIASEPEVEVKNDLKIKDTSGENIEKNKTVKESISTEKLKGKTSEESFPKSVVDMLILAEQHFTSERTLLHSMLLDYLNKKKEVYLIPKDDNIIIQEYKPEGEYYVTIKELDEATFYLNKQNNIIIRGISNSLSCPLSEIISNKHMGFELEPTFENIQKMNLTELFQLCVTTKEDLPPDINGTIAERIIDEIYKSDIRWILMATNGKFFFDNNNYILLSDEKEDFVEYTGCYPAPIKKEEFKICLKTLKTINANGICLLQGKQQLSIPLENFI